MMPLRCIRSWSRTAKLIHTSSFDTGNPLHPFISIISNQTLNSLHSKSNGFQCRPSVSLFHTMNGYLSSKSPPKEIDKDKIALVSSQMNMRLLNENSFLSWCRNAYLSSVVGIAMMEQATSILAQSAGFAAFLVGGLNVFWGTSCHVLNLVKLRYASGMSGFTLTLNVLGSLFHCLLWLCILICYIGFLDDVKDKDRGTKETSDTTESGGMDKRIVRS